MAGTILALDTDRVSRLTGIPRSTLMRWEREGVFVPSYVHPNVRTPFRRIYSFRDAVSLRTLAKLRRELRVPLEDIRKAGKYLSHYHESPWAELRFGVVDRRLVFWDPELQQWMGSDGQRVIELNMAGVPQEIEQGIPSVLEREPHQHGRITSNRYVHHGKPIIAGTRIPTSTIWTFHEAGYTPEEIQREYPHLTLADIEAALDHERRTRAAA